VILKRTARYFDGIWWAVLGMEEARIDWISAERRQETELQHWEAIMSRPDHGRVNGDALKELNQSWEPRRLVI